MSTIVVNDLSNVSVDGTPAGSVTDVLANYKAVPGIRSDLLDAIQAWRSGRDQSHAEDRAALTQLHETRLAELVDAHVADVARVREAGAGERAALVASHEAKLAEGAATVAARDAEIVRLKAEAVEKQALIDRLGGTELGQKMEMEARLRAAQEAKARADAELEAIKGQVAEQRATRATVQ